MKHLFSTIIALLITAVVFGQIKVNMSGTALIDSVNSTEEFDVDALPDIIQYDKLSEDSLISLAYKGDVQAILELTRNRDISDTVREYMLLLGIEQNSTECMIQMGDLYKDSKHDLETAMMWYVQAYNNKDYAFERSSRDVASYIASIYFEEGNAKEAHAWFLRAGESEINLAKMFYDAKYYSEAYSIYADWANDSKEALYMKGYMLLHGQGTYKNEREAKRLFEKAADKTNRELLGKDKKGNDKHISICKDRDSYIERCWGNMESVYTWPENKDSYWTQYYFYYYADYLKSYDCVKDEGYAPALYQLGIIEEQAGHYIEAADYYRRATAKMNVDAKVALARLLVYNKVTPLENEKSAMTLFDEAFEEGNVNTKLLYAKMYEDGVGVTNKPNPVEAVYWYTQAAEQGSVEAQAHLGCIYMYGKNSFPVYDKAVYWLGKAADQNDADSQNRLGELYEKGLGVPQNSLKAKDFYEKAATNSDYKSHEAQYNLGSMYDYGIGKVSKNPQQAVRWYQEAAEAGYAPALARLGVKWLEGDGVPQRDNNEALKNLIKAADQGYAPAYWELGNCYRYGKGVDVNPKAAMQYYLKAAQYVEYNSDVEYWFLLGEIYDNGTFEKPNYKEAFKWYKKAADRGHAKAQLRIAQYYEEGKSVKKNLDLAFNGYLTAANQDDMEAMARIVEMYEQGIGTFKNTEEAERWRHKLEMAKTNKEESQKDKICSMNILQPINGDRLRDTHVVLEYEAENMDMSSWVLNLRVKREDLTFSVRPNDEETNRHIIEFDLPDVNGDYDIQLCATNKDKQSVWTESITFTYEQAPKPDIWILSVGVTTYKDKSYTPVKFAVDEAAEFEQIIKNYSGKTGENYGSIHSYSLFNEDASRMNIINRLDDIKGGMKERDKVYLFFSGHGEDMPQKEESYFVSQDAYAKNYDSGVTFEALNRRINEMKKMGVVIMFMDACHSGNLLPNIISGDQLDNFALQKGCIYFLSCLGEQESYEWDDVHHGVFTQALFEGLKGNAQNELGEVTTKSLYEYIIKQVPDYANKIQQEQTPVSSAADVPDVVIFPAKSKK